jgi:Phosphotransferase enzyme family
VMTDLHQATAGWLTFDPPQLDRWVAQPLRILSESAGLPAEQLVPLGRRLCQALGGHLVPSARIHGDLGLHHALFDTQGRLTGLVDWEWSDTGPVFLDRCSLALSALAVHSDQDIGAATLRCLEDPDVFRTHPALAQHTLPEIDGAGLVLFTWLHTVVPRLRSAPPGGANRYWLVRNVTSVLAWEGEPALSSR